MRHRVTVKKFNKVKAHREAMFSNMLVSLFKYEKVETTKEKGRVLKALADSIIHRAKEKSVHNIRMVSRYIKDKKIIKKLFDDIAGRYSDRNGGYVRRFLSYKRFGDSADMCIVVLIDSDVSSTKNTNK